MTYVRKESKTLNICFWTSRFSIDFCRMVWLLQPCVVPHIIAHPNAHGSLHRFTNPHLSITKAKKGTVRVHGCWLLPLSSCSLEQTSCTIKTHVSLRAQHKLSHAWLGSVVSATDRDCESAISNPSTNSQVVQFHLGRWSWQLLLTVNVSIWWG